MPGRSKLAGVRTPLFSGRLAAAGSPLPSIGTSTAAVVPLTLAIGLLFGVLLVAKPILIFGVIALALAAAAIALALTRPDLAFGGLVVLLGLIPIYASPKIGPITVVPAALASYGVAIALMWRNYVVRGYLMRWNYVDVAAIGFFALMFISLSFSPRTELTDYVHEAFIWIGPYFAARTLLAEVASPVRVLAGSFAIVTAILAPIAAVETLGGTNPFFNLNFNSAEFNIWGSQLARFGSTRAVTSWGHPISFSIFLASSALLSFAMAISSREAKERVVWFGVAVTATATMSLTLSRTGWVMIAIGIVLLAFSARGAARGRLFALIGVIVIVILLMSILLPSQLSVLPGFSHAQESSYETSGLYRQALLHRALQPGVLHLWGNIHNMVTPAVGFDKATDNSYIILADTWGLIPTFALFAVGASMLLAVARSYGQFDGEPIAIMPIAAFTTLVAIFFVALITQLPVLIWTLIGAGGVAAERAGAARAAARLPRRGGASGAGQRA